MNRPPFRIPLFWRLQICGWGAVGLLNFLNRSAFWGDQHLALILTLVLEPLYLVLSSGMRLVYKRLEYRRGNMLKVAAVIIGFSTVGTIIQLFAGDAVRALYLGNGAVAEPAGGHGVRVVFCFMLLSGWSLTYLWLKADFTARDERERRLAMESAAQRSELEMLRLQLNPHFLFNSLNNIHTEIPERPELASEMLLQLAQYLRHSLDYQGELLVPLEHEIKAAETYLAIESGRFSDRLVTQVNAPSTGRRMRVPSFLLQPLVENAVKHGLNSSLPPWKLAVDIRHEEGSLRIRVTNTGVLASDWATRDVAATGIANLKRRLALHYPGRHRFSLSDEAGLVAVDLILEGEPCPV